MIKSERPGCFLGLLFRAFRNPLPGEKGSPYHPVRMQPDIPVDLNAPNSAWAASYERSADNLDAAGAHEAANRLREVVEKLDNGVKLK